MVASLESCAGGRAVLDVVEGSKCVLRLPDGAVVCMPRPLPHAAAYAACRLPPASALGLAPPPPCAQPHLCDDGQLEAAHPVACPAPLSEGAALGAECAAIAAPCHGGRQVPAATGGQGAALHRARQAALLAAGVASIVCTKSIYASAAGPPLSPRKDAFAAHGLRERARDYTHPVRLAPAPVPGGRRPELTGI